MILSLNIGNNFFNFFVFLLSDDLNSISENLFDFYNFTSNFNNLFNCLNASDHLLNFFFNNERFNTFSIYWDWNLNWHDNCFVNFDHFTNLLNYWDNLINNDFSRNFCANLNNFFNGFLNNLNDGANLLFRNNFFNEFLNYFRLRIIVVALDLYLFDLFRIHWNLNNFFDFKNLGGFN